MEMAIPADVVAHKTFVGARWIKTWRDERASCRVLFDDAGLVVGAWFQETPDLGVFWRIRRMLPQ